MLALEVHQEAKMLMQVFLIEGKWTTRLLGVCGQTGKPRRPAVANTWGITELSPAALGFGPRFVSGLRAPGARRPTGGTPPACCPQPRKAPLGT